MPKIATLIHNTLNSKHTISLAKLRRKAAKLGLTIEIDRIGKDIGYWIDGSDWLNDTYCSSKEELNDRLDSML